MDPFSLIIGFGLFALGAVAVTALWHRIVPFVLDVLMPWFKRHLPLLAPLLESAFLMLDKIVGHVRKAAIQAWRQISTNLLSSKVTYKREGATFTEEVENFTEAEGRYYKQTASQEVSMDDLPPDVREAMLRAQQAPVIDVRATYEQAERELTL